jgi:diketogulonate reductase-like aldo/keto reductase
MTSIDTAQAYRANARQCLSWAESAGSMENREAFFALAKTWESAAAHIEKAALSRATEQIEKSPRDFATEHAVEVRRAVPLSGSERRAS